MNGYISNAPRDEQAPPNTRQNREQFTDAQRDPSELFAELKAMRPTGETSYTILEEHGPEEYPDPEYSAGMTAIRQRMDNFVTAIRDLFPLAETAEAEDLLLRTITTAEQHAAEAYWAIVDNEADNFATALHNLKQSQDQARQIVN